MQFKHKFIITIILSAVFSNGIQAQPLVETMFSTDVTKTQAELNYNESFRHSLDNAMSKFENLNIKVCYDDLHKLIMKPHKNDFYLLITADKAAEYGFFDLATLAYAKIKDVDISSTNIEEYKKFYYPKNSIPKADILVLAELYSNIAYNDRAQETIQELQQYPRFLRDYDYANYLMALGYYKLNDIPNAQKYIDTAVKQNNTSINYKILQAKILSGTKKGKLSKKIIEDIKNKDFTTAALVTKINAAEEYINYLTAKKSFDKDYHLGKYYFVEGDYAKSSKILMGAVSKNKKNNASLYSLIARCSFEQGDYTKSQEYTKKAYKITKTNPNCLIALGDLKMKEGDLKSAVKYYKSASSNKDLRQIAFEKTAYAYTKLYSSKRGQEMYKDIIKDYKNSYLAYYKYGLGSGDKETDYLKKSVSLNIMYQDGWIDLARVMLEKGNIDLAKNYLLVAGYIDDKNFRYYYYQNLLKKKETELNYAANKT